MFCLQNLVYIRERKCFNRNGTVLTQRFRCNSKALCIDAKLNTALPLVTRAEK